MTSANDDLEEALRENLKLRSELAAEVAKAKQTGGIAYRLGWVIYWTCLTLALCWFLGLFLAVGDGSVIKAFDLFLRRLREDPLPGTLIWAGPTLVLYGIGRAFRYVLSGE